MSDKKEQRPPAPTESPTPAGAKGRHPLVEMLIISAPTVVTMTSYTVMQFIDGMMVSRVKPADPVNIAAQGNGGILVWVAIAAMIGVLSMVNTFVSQNLGAGTPKKGSAYAWAAIWLSIVASILLIPYALAMPWFFTLMGHEPLLVELETEYAQILLMGAFFTIAGRGIAHYFFGMHRPAVVMVSVISANLFNVVLNAVLIFGKEGPPEGTPFREEFAAIAQGLDIEAMGIAGAALGTVLGTALEVAIPMLVFLSPRWNRAYGTRHMWRPRWAPIKDILRVGWPAGLMMGNELICWGYLMAVLLGAGGAALVTAEPGLTGAALGDAQAQEAVVHNAAGWIALRYMHVSFMPAVGLSIAVSAMVGKAIGAGRHDEAARRAWLGLKVTLAYMGLCALAFIVFREEMMSVFVPADMSEQEAKAVLEVGATVMIAAAVFQLFDAMAITMSGALRGAGDTVWPGVVTIILSWVFIVGLGHLLIWLAPGLGSIGPWIGASAYIMALGLAMIGRFLWGPWRRIDLLAGTKGEGGGEGGADTPIPETLVGEAGEEVVAGMTPGSA